MHKYILAIMTCLILLKAISADPVKAAENPEQKEMQQRIEQHFRTKAEHFGLKTEGKDLKEVRKEITIIEEAKKRENVWRTAQTLRIQTEGKTMNELIKDVRKKSKKIKRGRSLFLFFMPIVLISEPFQLQQLQIHSLYYQLSCPRVQSLAQSFLSLIHRK